MSAFNNNNPRKHVLERLRDKEKSRDWSMLDKSHINRSWSAESYKAEKFVSSRKPHSPRHLPRLENGRPASVDSSYDQDLKRVYQSVIPPVPVGQRNGEFVRDVRTKGKDATKEMQALQRQYGDYTYPAQSSYYPYPSVAPPPHPSLMYPVPMIPVHPGYAPWLAPQLGFYGPTDEEICKGPQFALWRYMSNKKHSRRFVEGLIDSFLTDEIIPDILIDVFSGEKFLSVQDPRYKASERVCREIIHQDVTAFIHEIAIGVFYSHGGSSLSRRDPLFTVCDDIVNEVVKESTAQLVRSAVDELVLGHMTVIKSGDWLEDFILETIQPMLPRVVTEAMQGSQYDVVIDDIIDDVTDPQLRQVIIEAWRDVVDVDRNKQIKKVSVYAEDHMLDALCLQHLLSQLAGDNLSLYFRDYTDQALDGMICRLLTQQYLAVNAEQQATQSNSAVKQFHGEVFCDVALDVLLEELTAHLDEDIQELLEQEKQRNTLDL
ncbi:hypothetical protein OS493_018252 [Desmophyllum pertusum]|uniref:Uncharacterized protein n=1 Tax=Desmophyllum pertusum TaxID=174260 RepID=A0A9W9YBW1_9CNID|nr:hypothetical protein OS493_018252 [Desmophyllum pertusum]